MEGQRVVKAPIYKHSCGGFFMEFELRMGWMVFFTKTAAMGVQMHVMSPESISFLHNERDVPEGAIGHALCHTAHTGAIPAETHAQWVKEQSGLYANVMEQFVIDGGDITRTLEGEDVMVDYITKGGCVQTLFDQGLTTMFDQIVNQDSE